MAAKKKHSHKDPKSLPWWRDGNNFGWWLSRVKGKEMLELSYHTSVRLARENINRCKED